RIRGISRRLRYGSKDHRPPWISGEGHRQSVLDHVLEADCQDADCAAITVGCDTLARGSVDISAALRDAESYRHAGDAIESGIGNDDDEGKGKRLPQNAGLIVAGV